MSIIDYGDSAAMGMMQGTPGGAMGMAFGAASGIANRAMDEQAMKDQYFQQLKLNNMALSLNKNMYDYQMNRQFEFWDKTNYKAQVEQMRKAGLNPALLYGKGGGMGATTGNASAGNFQSQAGSDTSRMDINLGRQAQIMQMSLLASQKANIDADTKNKEANTTKTSGVDTELARTSISNILADIENKQVQKMGYELDNQLKDIELLVSGSTAQIRIDKLAKELDYTNELIHQIITNNNILDATKDAIITKAYADMENSIKDLSLKDAQINKLKTEIDLMIDRFEWDKLKDFYEVKIGLYNAENGRVRNAIETAYLDLEKEYKGKNLQWDKDKFKAELQSRTLAAALKNMNSPVNLKTLK